MPATLVHYSCFLWFSGSMSGQEPGAAFSHQGWSQLVQSTVRRLPSLQLETPIRFGRQGCRKSIAFGQLGLNFLGDETTEVRATERVDADALKVPVREDASVDDEHPPYDMEQIPLGENPGRHTAGGDMLRRTMNAAARESDVESATVRGTQVANYGLVPSTRANVRPSGAAQGSPDRYPGTVFQQLL